MKLRTLLLCVAAALSMTLCAAAYTVDSGSCGGNVAWTLDGNGVLTISGAGRMDDYGYQGNSGSWKDAPWAKRADKIVSAVIGDGVTHIGANAFYGCGALTGVTISGGVASIGAEAFCSCASLTSVAIPNGVASIGERTFYGCNALTSVAIPASVTAIGDSAFSDCNALTSVTIPDRVASVGDYAFWSCDSLTSVTIGSGARSIGVGAFSSCASLTSVTIPDNVGFIGDSAFSGCESLSAILVGPNRSEVSVLIDQSRSTLVWHSMRKPGAYTIPDGVTRIGNEAFLRCASLMSVKIPDGVTVIGDHAFSGCASLKSLTISDSVTSVGDYAFADCASLASLTIPHSLTAIQYGAFFGCAGLTSLTIPDSVTSIEYLAFSGCESLQSVTIPDSVTFAGRRAFLHCDSLTDVYYGGSRAQWKEIFDWWEADDALKSVTVHCDGKDVGVGITLTDENGNAVDANGQTGDTPETKENAFSDGAGFTANFDAFDFDFSSGLVTASVFIIFYDEDGLMVSLESTEIDLSNPFSLLFMLDFYLPEGAATLKFIMLGDNFEPLRAARMIDSSGD